MEYEQLRGLNERMRRIERNRLRIVERTVGELDILTSQHRMLMYLSRAGHVDSQTEIAEKMHVSPARVTLVLKSLIAEGYIERANGTDGRRNEIAITEKGQKLVERSRVFFRELDTAIYAGFTDAELEQFTEYLERTLENLDRIEEHTRKDEEA